MLDKEIEKYTKMVKEKFSNYDEREKFLKIMHIENEKIYALCENSKMFIFKIVLERYDMKKYLDLINVAILFDNKIFEKCKTCKYYSICINKSISNVFIKHVQDKELKEINDKLLIDDHYGCVLKIKDGDKK